MFSNQ